MRCFHTTRSVLRGCWNGDGEDGEGDEEDGEEDNVTSAPVEVLLDEFEGGDDAVQREVEGRRRLLAAPALSAARPGTLSTDARRPAARVGGRRVVEGVEVVVGVRGVVRRVPVEPSQHPRKDRQLLVGVVADDSISAPTSASSGARYRRWRCA